LGRCTKSEGADFSVPRLWIKFYQGVIAKFPEDKLYPLLEDPNRKEEIKRQIRTSLGFADLQITTTGAAITPAFLKEFYKKLDIYLLEAYGMTEVCGSFSNAVKPCVLLLPCWGIIKTQ